MENKKIILFVEKLDEGYVMQEGNKKSAVSFTSTLNDYLINRFKELLENATIAGINNFTIEVILNTNVPQSAP